MNTNSESPAPSENGAAADSMASELNFKIATSLGWAIAMAIALQTDLALLWGGASLCAVLLVGFLRRRRAEAPSRMMDVAFYASSAATGAIAVSFPVYLWLSGDFAMAAAGALSVAAMCVGRVITFQEKPAATIAAVALPAAALVLTPLVAGLGDPGGVWGPYLIATGAGALFLLEIFSAWSRLRQAHASMKAALVEAERQASLSAMLFDQSSIWAYLLDRDMRFVRASAGVYKHMAGVDFIGRPFHDVVRNSPAHWREMHQRALNGETIRLEEDEVVLPNGSPMICSSEICPWYDADGAISGTLIYVNDVTASVLARRAEFQGAERLQVALQASNAVVFEIDFHTNTISWHGDPLPIYGREPGARDFEVHPGSIYVPEDYETIEKLRLQVRTNQLSDIEHRIQRPDGGIRWVRVTARSYMNAENRRVRGIYLATDITERKIQERAFLDTMHRAENGLAAKRALLADLAREGGLAESGELEELSRAAPLEATTITAETGIGEMFSRFNRLLKEVENRDGALARAVRSLHKAREDSESANLAKSQFLANMSHELRTPLNAIIGYSEILLEEAQADARDSDIRDLERVLVAARALLVLINEILDLSKIEAGRMDVAVGDFEVGRLVDDAVATVRPLADKNGNRLEVNIDPALDMGRSDAFKLTQCLLNLLSNASKFTSEGTITVTARKEPGGVEDWLSIEVSDTGIGMSDEQMQRLFQPFAQADTSTTRRYGGTGLGLVITRRMMQLLGGDVSVKSVLGQGAVFTLRAPLRFDADTTEEPSAEMMAAEAGNGPIVLVIDDEANARDIAVRSLSRLGFRVRCATSAAAGLRAARATTPTLVLLDINLPDRSGWSVFEEMNGDKELSRVPVIMHSIHDDRQRALSMGACEHFVKPADRDVLASAVLRFARQQGEPQASAASAAAAPQAKSA
jgi:signal transduction histidine kinase/CheY-like chemotaxis protein